MRPTIVVGLGGGGGWHALAWATNEALSSGARLVLCHACRPDSVLASRGPAAPTGLPELVDPALARAVTSARTRLGGDRVTLRVLPGRPEHLLVEGAADAVADGALDGAGCPVAVVHDWDTQGGQTC
ncbi:universal stress protein [Micromonospora sp. NPDC049679]|uniref:universal stress protein n=1 Tax=Micromonospora sp. NPDC049679 TaxID=3155920 RepID=UPI0033CD8F2A